MSATVIGLFDTYADAEAAVRDLVNRGIDRNRISLVANRYATGYTGNETFETTTADNAGHTGTGHGAKTGSVVGGLTGFLIGMGFLAIPGVGPLLAAGPILSTLAGAGLGAAAGGLLGALTKAGVPKEHAELYSEGVRRGGTLVTVDAPDGRENEIAPVLDMHNAVDIDQRATMYRQTGYTGYAETLPEYTPTQIDEERNRYAVARSAAPVVAAAGTQTVKTGESAVIPVVEEQLVVGKREVERGGARIHTYVTETPVQEQVTLREEHVTVERHAVNRAVNQADLNAALTNRTIEVTETGQEAVVAKTARVVEEVVVGKEASQHTETVQDTVRRTDVDVVELDADNTTTTTGTTTGTGTTTPPRSNY